MKNKFLLITLIVLFLVLIVPSFAFAAWTTPNPTLTYDSNGGTGTVTGDTYPSGTNVILSSGDELSRTDYVLAGWDTSNVATSPAYLLGAIYNITSNTSLYAVWAPDDDNDGISNTDETDVGTDINNATSKPSLGKITGTVIDIAGNPVSGHTLVLNSSPITTTTNASGGFSFSNISLSNHTLTLRNGLTNLGTYSFNFSNGALPNAVIQNNGATSKILGTVNVTTDASSFGVNVEIQLNGGAYWQLNSATISPLGVVINPQTGYDNNYTLPYVLLCLLGAFSFSWYFKRKFGKK
jgi:hypothetical protein